MSPINCGVCKKSIIDDNYYTGFCGHPHHDRCWKGACNPCKAERELRQKQITRENWTTVAHTVVIFGLFYVLMRR